MMHLTVALCLSSVLGSRADSDFRATLRRTTTWGTGFNHHHNPEGAAANRQQWLEKHKKRIAAARLPWQQRAVVPAVEAPAVVPGDDIAAADLPLLDAAAAGGHGPEQYVRATLNIMRAVYTTIEEITPGRRRLRNAKLQSKGKKQPRRHLLTLTAMLDQVAAEQEHQMDIESFIKETDAAEARNKSGEGPIGNTDVHKGEDGKHFILTHRSITGKSHGTFERVVTAQDDGSAAKPQWQWRSNEHCPEKWRILDSPDASAEMMIFLNEEKKLAVIAFRGSESEISDWKTNFDALRGMLHMTSATDDDAFISVEGHEGFIGAFNANRTWLRHALRKHVSKDFKLVVTGHSQGAALAYIGALITTVEFGREVEAVIPYAAPHMGFDSLNQLYEKHVGCDKTLHFYANWDPVPRVPFRMDRPCESTRSEHELTCDFNIWHFWKCHYADTYQHEVRGVMASDESTKWDTGCEA